VILLPLRRPFAEAQGLGSGLRLRTAPELLFSSYCPLFCHSDPERSEGEESPQETLRAKALRVTEKGSF